MERIVRVHHGGEVLDSDNGGAKFSSNMVVKVVVFKSCPTLSDLKARLKDIFGSSKERSSYNLEGRYDIGHGRSHKVMMQLETEDEWDAYLHAVRKSEWKSLEVVVKIVEYSGEFDLNLSPIDEADVSLAVGNAKVNLMNQEARQDNMLAITNQVQDDEPQGVNAMPLEEMETLIEAKEVMVAENNRAGTDEFDEAVVGDQLTPRVFNELTNDDIPYDAQVVADSDDDEGP